jgi:hypothetical protein
MASSQVNNMIDLALNIFLTLLAFVGFLFNVYIVISVAMTKQVRSGVNFTNNLRAAFVPIFFCKISKNLKCKYKNLLEKLLYQKVARKRLVKFTSSHIRI